MFPNKKSRLAAARDTRGVSLLLAMSLTLILILLAGTASKLVLTFLKNTYRAEQANAAFFVAEAGVELALYDLSGYEDGYETDPGRSVCGSAADASPARVLDFNQPCDSDNPYRFVNFSGVDSDGEPLSRARGFWRIFDRTLEELGAAAGEEYVIPNPYFKGDKTGDLSSDEWGVFSKQEPFSLSLLIDEDPDEVNPKNRFDWITDAVGKKVVLTIDQGQPWNDASCVDVNEDGNCDNPRGAEHEDVLIWTFSGVSTEGEEFTLQGVVREDDFSTSCEADEGAACFTFDFAGVAPAFDGEVVSANFGSVVTGENRVAGINEKYYSAQPEDFIDKMNDAMSSIDPDKQWSSARLTFDLVGSLAETSGVTSEQLRFKVFSDDPLSDDYNYIISEGYQGQVKQSIETRFKRHNTVSIFGYAIFQ